MFCLEKTPSQNHKKIPTTEKLKIMSATQNIKNSLEKYNQTQDFLFQNTPATIRQTTPPKEGLSGLD